MLRRLMMRMRRRRMMMVGGQGGEGGGRRRKGKWIKLPAGREERGVMAKSLQLLHDPRGRRVAGFDFDASSPSSAFRVWRSVRQKIQEYPVLIQR